MKHFLKEFFVEFFEGTLTEDGLDLMGVVPASKGNPDQPQDEKVRFEDMIREPKELNEVINCYTCNGLAVIEQDR